MREIMYDAARYILWLLPIVCLATLLLRMLRGSSHRRYPLFFLYAAGVVTQSFAGLVLYLLHLDRIYFYFYWPSQAVLVVLSYAAMYEIVRAMLRRYDSLSHSGGWFFGIVALALGAMSVAAVAAWMPAQWMSAILLLQQAARFVQLGMLFLLLGSTLFLNLRWRQHSFGIALGFGVYGSLDLLIAVLTRAGIINLPKGYVLLDPLAYNLAVFIWLAYLFQPEREPVLRVLPATEIENWNEALGEYLRR